MPLRRHVRLDHLYFLRFGRDEREVRFRFRVWFKGFQNSAAAA